MILGHSSQHATAAAGSVGRATLDDMFLRSLARRPDTVALSDPPDRSSFIGGTPRRLTYAEADRIVTAIAGRLRRMGLQTDQVVGLQLPNCVEAVLTLLGILRAGLIAAPIPLLWRTADAAAALSQVGAKVLVTGGRVGGIDLREVAMHVAAEVFPIRYVCGYGGAPPDGVVDFDDLISKDADEPFRPIERSGNPAAHVAVVTWEVKPGGLVAVARNHGELLAGGLAVALESRMDQDATMLSAMATGSFAGLAMSVLPWLVVGGTLTLHQPFDAAVLAEQCQDAQPSHAFVPGPLAGPLADAGVLARRHGLKSVIAGWRAPERLANSALWSERTLGLVDLQIFGEIGFLAARRGDSGRPAAIACGPVHAPRGAPGAFLVIEVMRSAYGTVALRGPMVPRFPFASGADADDATQFRVGEGEFVDTGYGSRTERDTGVLVVTAPPPGMVSVGGYRFASRNLQDLAARIEPGGTLAALPDRLGGHRLAGNARDRDGVREALDRLGVNPLVAAAFRDRRTAAG
jgi:hypothetical protein